MPTGLEELDIKVLVDYRQERVNPFGPYVFATDGTHINSASKTNCLIDPVTLSTFGMPLPMTKEWNDTTTPTTGNYSRYQIYDFIFTGTGGAVWWNFNQYKKPGNSYIFSISNDPAIQSAPIKLDGGVKRNEPLFFSFSKLDKKGSDNQILLKLYWENATNHDRDTQLHFRSDGSCDVFRGYTPLTGLVTTFASSAVVSGDGTKFLTEVTVGTYIYDQFGRQLGQVANIVNDVNLDLYSNAAFIVEDVQYNKKVPLKIQSYSRTESNYNKSRPVNTVVNPNDQFNDVYIIPCRGTDLLVLTSFGLNFCHTFSDNYLPNPPGNVTNLQSAEKAIILPSGDFAIQLINGKVSFQLAKLNFLSNWSAYSQLIVPPNQPPTLPTYYTDISNNPAFISYSQSSKTVTGYSSTFTSELNPGDRLLAYTVDYETLFIGIVDTITSDTSLELVNFPVFSSSLAPGSVDVSPSPPAILATKYMSNAILTGTITVAINSAIVNGTGTLFTSQLELGDYIYDSNGIFIGIVQAIISDTNLALFNACNVSGTINYYINFNQYTTRFINAQVEYFGIAGSSSLNTLQPATEINPENDGYKIKIAQESSDPDPLSSDDYGFMFYSVDFVFNMLNVYTPPLEATDISSALTQFNLSRSENGDLTLHLETRKKFLEDLGIDKPEILANRPIQIVLSPRNKLLTGEITIDTTVNVSGVGTLFTSELSPGDTIYKSDGTLIGIVLSITNNTNLTLISINPSLTIEYNIDFKNEPNYFELSIFEGFLSSPQINYIVGENYNKYSNLVFSAIDKKQHLNKMFFDTAPNFDNISLQDGISQALLMSGGTSNDYRTPNALASPTILTYQVPLNRNNSNGQYNYGLNLGDSSGSYIEKIRSDFANNFTSLYKNNWNYALITNNAYINDFTFQLIDLDFISYLPPNVVLYLNEETAENYGGIPIYESYKRTIRSASKVYEQPEANRVVIVGLDKSSSGRITEIINDEPSQNYNTLPQNRPNNWLGEVSPFVYMNEKLNSLQDVKQVAQQYFNRITKGRELIEFDSDLLYYYDSSTKVWNSDSLVGQITIDTTVNVSGVGTFFTVDLSPGDYIYKSSNGAKIGMVKNIISDTQLELFENYIQTIEYNIDYNKNTIYLNEYQFIDIGDIISINDLENNTENYQILEWSLDVVKDNHLTNQINVRNVTYKGKKIDIPANNAPIFSFSNLFSLTPFAIINNTQPASNLKIISVGDILNFDVTCYVINNPWNINTITLSNAPSGMTLTQTSNNLASISFTPTIGQANQIYKNITVTSTLSEGGSATYSFDVRVYDQT